MLSQAERFLEQGKAQAALPLLGEWCKVHPQDAHAWFLLGACNHLIHDLNSALQALERALSIEPRNVQARCAKGAVLSDLGRYKEALQIYRKALHLSPKDSQLLMNIAITLEQMGDLRAALERYELALKHHPGLASALLNRGALLIRLGELREAFNNNNRLADLYPDWEAAQFNKGEALLALGQWEMALAAYKRALTINPRSAKTHFAAGIALSMLKQFEQAQQSFSLTQSIDPAIFNQCLRDAAAVTGGELRKFTPSVIYLLKEATRMDYCDWENWYQFVQDFEHLITSSLGQTEEIVEPALLFRACSLPVSGDTRLALARSISSKTAENVANLPPYTYSKKLATKLKIGYVSPDFRIHPIATVTHQLYTLHNREKFEVYGYSLHPGDGSQIRRDIEQGCDYFKELSGMNAQKAAEIIHQDGIDILIDLAGYTTHARPEIFAMRPAPLQLSYLGFLHTMGAGFIDYIIADQIVIPLSDKDLFSEKIAYLPNSYFLFDNQQKISPRTYSREELNLPALGFVFCCHNNSYKITPQDFDTWMHLLKRVPDSVLWLYKSSTAVVGNLRKEAKSCGVDPDRLIFANFAPNDEYIARYRMADLFLDTTYYNAQTTAADALWAGLPVITCPGKTMASRSASGLLNAIGLPELITHTPQQYEDLAVHLATHPEELARLRALLQRNRLTTPLFNTERQVKKIEAVYQHIWQRHQAGLPPETFQIAP